MENSNMSNEISEWHQAKPFSLQQKLVDILNESLTFEK